MLASCVTKVRRIFICFFLELEYDISTNWILPGTNTNTYNMYNGQNRYKGYTISWKLESTVKIYRYC